MEEIYVIKLKGLPTSTVSTNSITNTNGEINTINSSNGLKDAFKVQRPNINMDLSRKAIVGFSYIYLVLSILIIIFSMIDIIMINLINLFTLFTGLIYLTTGILGIWTSYKRKTKFIGSKRFVKYYLLMSLLSLIVSALIVITILFGYLHVITKTNYIRFNIIVTQALVHINSYVSVFTLMRVLWPSKFLCCAKKWPQNQCIKKKIIIATNILTRNTGNNYDNNLITSHIGGDYIFSLNKVNDCNHLMINTPSSSSSQSQPSTSLTRSTFNCGETNIDYKQLNKQLNDNQDIEIQFENEFNNEMNENEIYENYCNNERIYESINCVNNQANSDQNQQQNKYRTL